YYSDKLKFVAREAAKFAAGDLAWAGSLRRGATVDQAKADTVPVVNTLLQQMGLPAGTVDMEADDKLVTVTVSVNGLAMPHGTILPQVVDLKAAGRKRFDEDKPTSVY